MIYLCFWLCTPSFMYSVCSHYKGPEQDQLRSPFVPYVRNTAERSIHNFDSQPYLHHILMTSILRRSKSAPLEPKRSTQALCRVQAEAVVPSKSRRAPRSVLEFLYVNYITYLYIYICVHREKHI